jgi:hypothetical protein
MNKRAQEVKINFPCLSSKRAQEAKIRNFPCLSSKRAQEEIIGFGIILLLVAVVGVIFLSISLNKNSSENGVEDYEASSFLKAMLETTTNCEKNAEYVSVKDLIFECQRKYVCFNEENSCEILNDTIENIMEESWNVGNNTPVKGYELIVDSEEGRMINLTEGIATNSYKGASQSYTKTREKADIFLKIYS